MQNICRFMSDRLLTSEELEILSILWDEGPQKPNQLMEKLSFEIKNSALRWQLNELVERGYLRRESQGKAFFYDAAKPRRQVFGALTQKLKRMLFGGSAVAMIGEMMASGELSLEELRELNAHTDKGRAPALGKKGRK